MPGVLGTAWSGLRLLAIVLVGLFVASTVLPILLGVVTGALGVWVPMEAAAGVSLIGGVLLMGWLS